MRPGHRWFAAVYDPLNWLGERRLFGPLRRRLAGELHGRVLDVGAGTGANFPHYRAAELVVAADPDPYMLRRAVKKAAQARARVGFVLCAAEALPFGPASFDAAVATLVLCTVDAPDRALAELRRVLRPAATLSLVEHVRSDGWRGWLQDRIEPVWGRLIAGCHPNRRTGALLQSAGFAFDQLEERDLGTMQLLTGVARVTASQPARQARTEGAPPWVGITGLSGP
jgi:ubiquinone/menaquinone biosynthesis C-methylase UbiE